MMSLAAAVARITDWGSDMALPFLAMGLGLLGGKAFLAERRDKRDLGQSMLEAENFLMDNPEFAEANPGYLSSFENIRGNQGFFSDDSGQAESLLNAMRADEKLHRAAGEKAEDRRLAIQNQFDQDWARDVGQFTEVIQPSFQKALLALENPNSADSVAALYNFFNIVEPGGRITENEDGSFTGIGGSAAGFANMLNKWRGDGLSDETRKQIMSSIWKQYTPEMERAQRQKVKYEADIERMRGLYGQDIQSPIGRQGGNWSLNQMPPGYGQPTEQPQRPPVPQGMTVEDEW